MKSDISWENTVCIVMYIIHITYIIIYQCMAGWESVWISDVTQELRLFLVTEMKKAGRESKRNISFIV